MKTIKLSNIDLTIRKDITKNINYIEGKILVSYIISKYGDFSNFIIENGILTAFFDDYRQIRINLDRNNTTYTTKEMFSTSILNYISTNTSLIIPRKIVYSTKKDVVIDTIFNDRLSHFSIIEDSSYTFHIEITKSTVLEIYLNSIILKSRNIKLVGKYLEMGMRIDKIPRLYRYKDKYYLINSKYCPMIINIYDLDVTNEEDTKDLLGEYINTFMSYIDFKQFEIEDISCIEHKVKTYHVL